MSVSKYGIAPGGVRPDKTLTGAFLADDVLPAKSGRYVVYDRGDTYWRGVNTDEAKIGGWVDESFTADSTSGVTKIPIATNVNQFPTEMPYAVDGAAATLTEATLATLVGGKLMDVYVDGNNIQYADNLASPNQSVLRCVGGSVKQNTLYVVVPDSMIMTVA